MDTTSAASRPSVRSTVHGYPRIGPARELKRASESYWKGATTAAELDTIAADLRRGVYAALREAGVDDIPSNTFSYYDQVLDTAVLFDLVPSRFPSPAQAEDREEQLRRYFALARGEQGAPPLEMTKWFDTNYHYLVPELSPSTRPRLVGDKPVVEFREAAEAGFPTRPVLVGPLTFLLLAKAGTDAPEGWEPIALLDGLLDAYAALLRELAAAGATEVQLDEPILATDEGRAALGHLERCYQRLGSLTERPALLVSTYFGSIGADALRVLKQAPVEAVGLDLVTDAEGVDDLTAVSGLGSTRLVAGVVDGRNVWRTDLPAAVAELGTLLALTDELTVSTSCSLLHVPIDLDAETSLAPELRAALAFARQKAEEVALLGRVLSEGSDAGYRSDVEPRDPSFTDARVRARLDALGPEAYARPQDRVVPAVRPLATTTIGSFPQTPELRRARAAHRRGELATEEYKALLRAEIDRVITLQEEIGLDVLVHGEPERNDMVQYFAEQLEGYATTEHGWVQSYGSRCVRPPILFGDVARPAPMTVEWITYAQSRTDKPVKGMLTGPVTMLAWSFVRTDQPLGETARQVGLALRDEVADLERAGIRHIQVDEAALRELLPLRAERRPAYLRWAVDAFRLATSGVASTTTIHTHMCYSEFNQIVDGIEALDADVTSVEAARSRMELVEALGRRGYGRGIGPGVYDIHSPRVPSVEEVEASLRLAVSHVDAAHLWANPDCGLKTRGYAETEQALRNMVEAARRVRVDLPGT
ncbi:5-methyltetrahydropteroyltriglutamate--homocysteine S-methyltransferase [Nocardiopsis sp. MG754419]|uniref:5-methyltetrahydropteroyltriglutamate-- homocysteine S-methyltransferase n=1 Tax=Nocardiopsis sp. MG754419 TaxID=2259865 RepID=UPI001BA49292|nr:5-methyltetrahydropteroyltriglutamate--homocysteine S-methyltransferase [Nocardiopsis sp. MG754419]MBR8742519.1 5-methyltetrahydropteroyltriglutamate--homocysteine S-methyltransferase [Nocardiopsis sp. MG754419]